MVITTIIFDLGNVILTNDWHYDSPDKYREFSDYFDISYGDMERGWNSFWHQFRIGKISEEEFWNGFLCTAGAKKIDVEKAKKSWRKHQRPIENMLDLLEKLKRRYRLAALADIPKEWLDYKKAKYRLDSYFDTIVSSGYSGLHKPDPKIYSLVIEKLAVSPGKCLFIDDSKGNLVTAKQLKMKVILFTDQAALERKLHEMGLKF